MDIIDGIIFHNSLLAKAKESNQVEAISYYFQNLCQLENVVFLVGSGFPKHLGGPLMVDLSKKILPKVILDGFKKLKDEETQLKTWTMIWEIEQTTSSDILKHLEAKDEKTALRDLREISVGLNIEEIINDLKTAKEGMILLGKRRGSKLISEALKEIEQSIVHIIRDITPSYDHQEFSDFCGQLLQCRYFIRRLIDYRRPQQSRLKFFSTNYDQVIELVCDLEGILCSTGFEGQAIRIFNPTNFDLNISLKATGQSSIYFSNLIQLYKLHGSVNWVKKTIGGIEEIVQDDSAEEGVVIYPCSTKYYETLEMPYGEMFRRFGDAIAQPQTVIFTLGYGFNDDHINQILMRGLKNPSCQMICIEPKVTDAPPSEQEELSDFLKNLIIAANPSGDNSVGNARICVIGGSSAKFPDIADLLVPPVELENPLDEAKKLVAKFLSLGEKEK